MLRSNPIAQHKQNWTYSLPSYSWDSFDNHGYMLLSETGEKINYQ